MSPESCEITGLAMSYFYTVEERKKDEILERIKGFFSDSLVWSLWSFDIIEVRETGTIL